MLNPAESATPRCSTWRRRVMRMSVAACAAGSLSLTTLALGGGPAGAASASLKLHYFQKQTALTFYNASDVVIQGYPPVGGHVKEDDVDYVGNHSHHAKSWTVSDHLFCTVVSAPANATCFAEFASGNSLIYEDNVTLSLASSSGAIPVDGGTGTFAGYTGSLTETSIGNTNNSDVVIDLHQG